MTKPIEYNSATKALRALADPRRAIVSRGFFKDSGGDVFLGVSMPALRKLARVFKDMPLPHVRKLMQSRIHEERSLANEILRLKFSKGEAQEQKKVFDFYVKNLRLIREWDSVDGTAPYIAGPYLLDRDKSLLYQLARSKRIWERRIAMVTTWWFIRHGQIEDALRIAEMLLHDEEDLIHKAVGWMLREAGQKDSQALRNFLDLHRAIMPRTTLRYAIEKFSPAERKAYMKKTISNQR